MASLHRALGGAQAPSVQPQVPAPGIPAPTGAVGIPGPNSIGQPGSLFQALQAPQADVGSSPLPLGPMVADNSDLQNFSASFRSKTGSPKDKPKSPAPEGPGNWQLLKELLGSSAQAAPAPAVNPYENAAKVLTGKK